jgi:hypothetical protein
LCNGVNKSPIFVAIDTAVFHAPCNRIAWPINSPTSLQRYALF